MAPQTDLPSDEQLQERDATLLCVVDECEAVLRAGGSIDREALLAQHPEIRSELEGILRGLDLIHGGLARSEGEIPQGPESPGPDAIPGAMPYRLGDFRLVRELGRGGMGIVYEAEQLSAGGRRVAVKVLPFVSVLDEARLHRFRVEAHAAARLCHRNIVPVHYVGEEEGLSYYVMQIIDGQPLSGVIATLRDDSAAASDQTPGELTSSVPGLTSPRGATRDQTFYRNVAKIGAQIAHGLEHAHEQGVVHRDVKPSNVLLDGNGTPWIADFGLARIEDGSALTVSGDVLGTLRYMSPEQARGDSNVDHRTDLRSLGATIAELATLHPVVDGETREEILKRVLFDDVRSIGSAARPIPGDLETILLKCLERSPAERYASAAALADDFERFVDGRPILARRPGIVKLAAKTIQRHRAVTIAALFAVAFVALALELTRRHIATETAAEYERLVQHGVEDGQRSQLAVPFGAGAAASVRYRYGRGTSWGPFDESPPIDGALADLAAAYSLVPSNPAAPYHAARLCLALGDNTAARLWLTRSLEAQPDFVPALALEPVLNRRSSFSTGESGGVRLPHVWAEAQQAAYSGQWREAANKYEKLVLDCSNGETYAGARFELVMVWGTLLLESGEAQLAAEVFRTAQILWPRALAPVLFRGRAYLGLDQLDRADRLFEDFLAGRPESESQMVGREIAIVYQLFGRGDRAVDILHRVPDTFARRVMQVRFALLRAWIGVAGEWDRAEEHARHALKHRPKSAVPHALLGHIFQSGFGEISEGARYFAIAERLDPDEPLTPFLRGCSTTVQGDPAGARALAEEALRRDPEFLMAVLLIAISYSQEGDHERAVQACERAGDSLNWEADALVVHGQALRLLGRLDEAEVKIRAGLRQTPASNRGKWRLGQLLQDQRRWKEAAGVFEETIHLGRMLGWTDLGWLHVRLGEFDEARDAFRRGCESPGMEQSHIWTQRAAVEMDFGHPAQGVELLVEWFHHATRFALVSRRAVQFAWERGVARDFARAYDAAFPARPHVSDGKCEELRLFLLVHADEVGDAGLRRALDQFRDDTRPFVLGLRAEAQLRLGEAAVAAALLAPRLRDPNLLRTNWEIYQRACELLGAPKPPTLPLPEVGTDDEAAQELAEGRPLRINCGGPAVTDADGVEWRADAFFIGERGDNAGPMKLPRYGVSQRVQPSHYSHPLIYRIPAPEGSYVVRLRFVEIFFTLPDYGLRLDVNGETARIAPSFDKDQVVEFETRSTNGEIVVRVRCEGKDAWISALEVLPSS